MTDRVTVFLSVDLTVSSRSTAGYKTLIIRKNQKPRSSKLKEEINKGYLAWKEEGLVRT